MRKAGKGWATHKTLAMKDRKKLGTPKGEVGSIQFDRDRVGDVGDCDGVRAKGWAEVNGSSIGGEGNDRRRGMGRGGDREWVGMMEVGGRPDSMLNLNSPYIPLTYIKYIYTKLLKGLFVPIPNTRRI